MNATSVLCDGRTEPVLLLSYYEGPEDRDKVDPRWAHQRSSRLQARWQSIMKNWAYLPAAQVAPPSADPWQD
jgi:hypothetical protein